MPSKTTQDCLYVFDKLKSKKDENAPARCAKIVFNVPTRRDLTIGEKAVEHGLAVAAGIKQCKDVGNMPPNICTPLWLAEQAKKLTELSGQSQSGSAGHYRNGCAGDEFHISRWHVVRKIPGCDGGDPLSGAPPTTAHLWCWLAKA